jgi:hypothetical protein
LIAVTAVVTFFLLLNLVVVALTRHTGTVTSFGFKLIVTTHVTSTVVVIHNPPGKSSILLIKKKKRKTAMPTPWYMFPRIDNYGSPDPFGGFPKPDSNIQIPANYPVTALLSGTVSGVNAPDGSIPEYGSVVTIKLDKPINQVATHTAYLHLASSTVGVGQHVNAGDLIGYNGSQNAAGSEKVPLGFALYNGDYYGYGPSWNQYLGSSALNPVGVLNAAANGQVIQSNQNGQVMQNSSTAPVANLKGFGIKAGMFVVAIALVGFGAYLTFEKQIAGLTHKAIEVGKVAALA